MSPLFSGGVAPGERTWVPRLDVRSRPGNALAKLSTGFRIDCGGDVCPGVIDKDRAPGGCIRKLR